MAIPRAFIGFDFDNNENEKHLFVGQSRHSRSPFQIQDWSCKAALPQNQWEQLIHDKIKKCDLMIVIVGKSMSTATGIEKEIAFARKHNVPFFGVYVDGANMWSPLPEGLARNRVISWTWDSIANAIDQMMTEGKHRWV